jgi:hypothetical protein
MLDIGQEEGELGNFTFGQIVKAVEERVLDHEFVGNELALLDLEDASTFGYRTASEQPASSFLRHFNFQILVKHSYHKRIKERQ